jgi:hypothetical protein
MPVILATWEAEFKRSQFKASTGQGVQEIPIQPIAAHTPVIPEMEWQFKIGLVTRKPRHKARP